MRLFLVALAIAGTLLSWDRFADAQGASGPYSFRNIGFCQMTSLATAKAVTTANCTSGSAPTQNEHVIVQICAETQAVRYRSDGTAPTASVGIPVPAGTCFQWSGDLRALQIIQVAASATVDLEFFY